MCAPSGHTFQLVTTRLVGMLLKGEVVGVLGVLRTQALTL
ncbi:BnaC01g41730D [Brassica napus]|uniref:BnaC01g41730D protein n=1 Tax=Brassica napus TaxID=3708 RepID=A0A078JED1_BRANA|nr:BnaC01g41730D [Brassica napus]